jgi:hypothetical protein
MTNITYEEETAERPNLAAIGEMGFYTVVGVVLGGFTLLVGMNWMMVGAMQGLVAVLGGGA